MPKLHRPVSYKKQKGSLMVTSDAVTFQGDDDDDGTEGLHEEWPLSDIAKCLANPPTSDKCVIKLVLHDTSVKAPTLTFTNRAKLDAAKGEIKAALGSSTLGGSTTSFAASEPPESPHKTKTPSVMMTSSAAATSGAAAVTSTTNNNGDGDGEDSEGAEYDVDADEEVPAKSGATRNVSTASATTPTAEAVPVSTPVVEVLKSTPVGNPSQQTATATNTYVDVQGNPSGNGGNACAAGAMGGVAGIVAVVCCCVCWCIVLPLVIWAILAASASAAVATTSTAYTTPYSSSSTTTSSTTSSDPNSVSYWTDCYSTTPTISILCPCGSPGADPTSCGRRRWLLIWQEDANIMDQVEQEYRTNNNYYDAFANVPLMSNQDDPHHADNNEVEK